MANENHHKLCPVHRGGACTCGAVRVAGVAVDGVFGSESDIVATLTSAVYAQHQAIDALLARLCAADRDFKPTQWREVWAAVEQGHKAVQDGLRWQAHQ